MVDTINGHNVVAFFTLTYLDECSFVLIDKGYRDYRYHRYVVGLFLHGEDFLRDQHYFYEKLDAFDDFYAICRKTMRS